LKDYLSPHSYFGGGGGGGGGGGEFKLISNANIIKQFLIFDTNTLIYFGLYIMFVTRRL